MAERTPQDFALEILKTHRGNRPIQGLEEQRGLQGTKQDEQEDGSSRKVIFSRYKKSRDFAKAYREASLRMFRPSEDLDMLRRHFSGKMFEDIAFDYLLSNKPPFSLVLSMDDTLSIYQRLYPSSRMIKNRFELDSLTKPVPDGLIIRETGLGHTVLAVCEYTLRGSEEYFEKKYEAFSESRKFFPEADLLFIIPSSLRLPRINFGDIRVLQTPFTRHQFREFIRGVLENFRLDENSPTLMEIRDRIYEQRDRARMYEALGRKQTDEYNEFLSKFAP